MADTLNGWREVVDSRPAQELSRVFAGCANIGNAILTDIAAGVDGYRNPSLCMPGARSRRGLTFHKSSGSVLLVLPWPDEADTVPIVPYEMGDVLPEHRDSVISGFQLALETHLAARDEGC